MNNADMPAMPQTVIGEWGKPFALPGLSKREYFAAMAMQGLLGEDVNHGYNARTVAKWSVEQADALLEELESRK